MINMDRLAALKHEVFAVTPELCSERARLITESYQATRGMPPILRRARALEHILAHRTLFVRPGELFVGAISRVSRGYEWYPEYTADIDAELDDVPKRAIDRYIVTEETKRELRDVFAYWRANETVQKDRCSERLRAVDQRLTGLRVEIDQYHIGAGDHALRGDVHDVQESVGRLVAAAHRV